METHEAIKKRRSIRKFQEKEVDLETLKELVDAARLAPSAANLQPLKYIIVTDKRWLDLVFPTLKWAGYIAPHGNPKKDERPAAYIIVLIDKRKEKNPAQRDIGAAVENILLLATSRGLATCWIAAVNKKELTKKLELSLDYEIDSVVALGYPREESAIEEWRGDLKYFKDNQGRMHVPKRNLKDIILKIKDK